jgi:hypothetical protein
MSDAGPTPISPWSDAADRASPDGRYRARVAEALEIRMGAPTRGTLVVTDEREGGRACARVEGCNPSLVWSSDSRALAVPQWTREQRQRLCVVSLPSGAVRCLSDDFAVLELHAFAGGVVVGVDSPAWLPTRFKVSVAGLVDGGCGPRRAARIRCAVRTRPRRDRG